MWSFCVDIATNRKPIDIGQAVLNLWSYLCFDRKHTNSPFFAFSGFCG